MKSLVIQHVAPEGLGLIGEVFAARGVETETVRVFAGDPVPARLDADGLVVMGGPMSVYDPLEHLVDETRLIRSAMSQDKPVLGVCLGSQLLASALGAVVKSSGRQEIGWHEVTTRPDPLWEGLPQSFQAVHWHGDIFDLPAGAKLLASSHMTVNQAFRVGAAIGLLFHLEMTREGLDGMAAAFPEDLAKVGLAPEKLTSDTREHLSRMRSLGRTVFGRWVDMLSRA